jgi:hypothetical protein
MSNVKYFNILFVIGFFSVVIFTSCIIVELSLNDLSITPSSLDMALATPISNSTFINTTLSSNNATTIEDSNGTLTTIPELEDRRHAPLR